jgi:hypothetical protein
MELKDLMELKALEGNGGMSPYEQFKTQHMQSRSHTSGVGIAGLVTGIAGVVIGGTAWLFGGMYGNAKANQAKEAAYAAKDFANMQYNSAIQLMNQQNQNTNTTLDRIARMLERETDARVQGDINLTTTINDTVSGSQQGTLSAQQAAELSAIQTATNTVTAGLMTGQYSQNPLRVVRVSGTRECPCDGGCGCNG